MYLQHEHITKHIFFDGIQRICNMTSTKYGSAVCEDHNQLTFTCSNSTMKTVEKGVKYVLVFLFLTLNKFHTFF